MRRANRFIVRLALLLAALWLSPAHADRRVALVIGNSVYRHATPLRNPGNDAADVAAALGRLGFEVVQGRDLDRSGMERVIREFARKLSGSSVALFYYAGHGLQVNGKNHLAPVEARLSSQEDLDFETVPLHLVLRQMEREKRTNLVFLDACRDNPLARNLTRSLGTRSAAVGRGLARVETGVGTLIAYATQPGNVALDGQGRNSPYTAALLEHMERPGIGINDLLISVRKDVISASGGKQVPWEHSSLTGKFYFTPRTAQSAKHPAPADGPPGRHQARLQLAFWNAAVSTDTVLAYQDYLRRFPGGLFASQARFRVDKLKRRAAGRVEPGKPATPQSFAAVEPAPKPQTPSDDGPKLAGRVLVLSVQSELERVGCGPGRVDGQWGRKSREALARFNRFAGLALPTEAPTRDAVVVMRRKTSRVCPVSCGPRQVERNGRCVAKVCPSGRVLNSRGTCIVKRASRPAAKATRPPSRKRSTSRRRRPRDLNDYCTMNASASQCAAVFR